MQHTIKGFLQIPIVMTVNTTDDFGTAVKKAAEAGPPGAEVKLNIPSAWGRDPQRSTTLVFDSDAKLAMMKMMGAEV